MKIGLLGGSFDPPHMGHLMIANYMVEFTPLDEVWLLVSPHNPLKSNLKLTDEQVRLQMVQQATHLHPRIKACDFEFTLPRPSYTYNTLQKLSTAHPEHEFTLLIGADNINVFDQWKDYEKLLAEYTVYVYPREGEFSLLKHPHVHYINAPRMDISSTRIRKSIHEQKNMIYYMPYGVNKIVDDLKLYL